MFAVGWGMATPMEIRLAPTVLEMGTTVARWTAGIPAASICLMIVAPQRVSVPHVEVNITPSTFPLIASAICLPKVAARSTGIQLPTVTKI